MSQSNRINEAYKADKNTLKDKVLVGLSGGIDSMVVAYLLKIQKYDLIAVTVVPGWNKLKQDPSNIISCSLSDKQLEKLQSFCHQLGIPHMSVKIPDVYKDRVVDRWLSRKLAGELPDQCWDCHDLRIEVLHEQMKEHGAKYLATGHFAKVFRNDGESVFFVQSSNDETNDQSHMLARLSQEILKDLLLPLSDLQQKEVLKLAENFGLVNASRNVEPFDCFKLSDELTSFVEDSVAMSLRLSGDIVSDDDASLGSHEGVFKYQRGELVSTLDRKPHFMTGFERRDNSIAVREKDWFNRKTFLLQNCTIPVDTPWSIPFRGVLIKDAKAIDAWIYPKTLNACAVELDEELSVIEGEILGVQKKRGKNARILLAGRVRLMSETKIEEEDEEDEVDHRMDF